MNLTDKQVARFWSKIDIGSPVECWEWSNSTNWKGYGHLGINEVTWLSHRLAWMLTSGDIPDGLCVLHECDNPLCCNPDHLFLGTHTDNMHDMIRKGRLVINNGSKNGRSKLTEDQVREIRKLKPLYSLRQLGKIFDVSHGAIDLVIQGKTWKHVTAEGNQ